MSNSNPPAKPTTEPQSPSLVKVVPRWVNKEILDTLGPIAITNKGAKA
jgi:hypothetical protein